MNERVFGVYSLRDRVADAFRSISIDTNDNTAKRNFAFAVQNTPELMFQAKDLELCTVGTFDCHTGMINPITPIQVICRGDEVLQK